MLGDIDEFCKGDLSVQILVSLDNGSIDQLLQLDIVEVIADHHLEYREQLSIWDVAIIVDVVDLESKSKLLLLWGGRGQTVESLYEFEERNASILVFIQNGDYSLDKGVLSQLYKNTKNSYWIKKVTWNVEELFGFEGAWAILINLLKVLVKLLQFLLSD